MKLIKVAAGALNQTPLDWGGNVRHIVAAIDEARSRGASILCLPELCITGYGCEDAFQSRGVRETALDLLLEIAPETRGIAVTLGVPVLYAGALFQYRLSAGGRSGRRFRGQATSGWRRNSL